MLEFLTPRINDQVLLIPIVLMVLCIILIFSSTKLHFNSPLGIISQFLLLFLDVSLYSFPPITLLVFVPHCHNHNSFAWNTFLCAQMFHSLLPSFSQIIPSSCQCSLIWQESACTYFICIYIYWYCS